jgi:CrcB protein
MNLIWLVAGGGAIGSVLRYGLASTVQQMTQLNFPLGTVVVNILGCIAIGLLYVWIIDRAGARPELRAFFMVGIMGGFTTFSSFSLETVTLMMHRDYGSAVLNVVVSVLACLAGTALGIMVARNL